MKGDNSRDTFRREKHYHAVRQQQGRVQLDADWNEQADIVDYLLTTTAADVIGGPASVAMPAPTLGQLPPGQGGFAITLPAGGGDLTITPGKYYVDGILCESNAPATLLGSPPGNAYSLKNQPDLPGFSLPGTSSTYLVYLDVWQRHITAVEDPAIREVALGGADTTTRSKTIAQVKLLAVAGSPAPSSEPPEFLALVSASSGRLTAQLAATGGTPTPCDVTSGAGFTGLENQLYRIEIHKGGSIPPLGAGGPDAGPPTFKWSRDNASVVAAWSSLGGTTNNVLVLQSPPQDDAHGFTAGQWVEVSDDTNELQGRPGTLVKLIDVDGVNLTFDPATIRNPDGSPQSPPSLPRPDPNAHAKLRRWDGTDSSVLTAVTAAGTPFGLENGIEVQFSNGKYLGGDYWVVPARTGAAATTLEWPTELGGSPLGSRPAPQPPRGVQHHYARLALVDFDASTRLFSNVRECRKRLPPLTGLMAEDVAFNVTPGAGGCAGQLSLTGPTTTVAAALEAICAKLSTITTPTAAQILFTSAGNCSALLSIGTVPVATVLELLCQRFTNLTTGALAATNLVVTNGIVVTNGKVTDQRIRDVAFAHNPVITTTLAFPNFANIPDMTRTFTPSGSGTTMILYELKLAGVTVTMGTPNSIKEARCDFQLVLDGAVIASSEEVFFATSTASTPAPGIAGTFETRSISLQRLFATTAGSAHTIQAQWRINSPQANAAQTATLQASSVALNPGSTSDRQLIVLEL